MLFMEKLATVPRTRWF